MLRENEPLPVGRWEGESRLVPCPPPFYCPPLPSIPPSRADFRRQVMTNIAHIAANSVSQVATVI